MGFHAHAALCAAAGLIGAALLRRRWLIARAAQVSASRDANAVFHEQEDEAVTNAVFYEQEDEAVDVRLLRRIETILRLRTSRVVMVLERLQDGHNYAAVMRTCEALGVQHVYLISPPKRADLFEAASKNEKRKGDVDALRREHERDQRRKPEDTQPNPCSRRALRRAKRLHAAQSFGDDDVLLDSMHASFARNAVRFLSVRTFESTEACLTALRDEGRQIWVTELSQGAHVLAAGAPWLREPEALPSRGIGLVIGTESTGASRELLAAADRRVYLPQRGFADSLNASVAAALTLQVILQLYGEHAVGDLAREASAAELHELRLRWIGHLARDAEQYEAMAHAVDTGAIPSPFDDVRRPDGHRLHTGRLRPNERRRATRAAKQEEHGQGGVCAVRA